MWGEERCCQVGRLLFEDGSSIVDTAHNMVALSQLVHHWWGEGTIAFEPLYRLQNGVRFRFRWLENPPARLDASIPLDTDPRLKVPGSHDAGSANLRHLDSGRLILDGEIIDIISEDPTATPSFEIFQLQWDLLRMARLSGAAEAAMDGTWDPDADFMLDMVASIDEGEEMPRSPSPQGGDIEEGSTKEKGNPATSNKRLDPGASRPRNLTKYDGSTGQGSSMAARKDKPGQSDP